MTEIDDLLEKNATETEVEKALEKVCGFLPDSVKTMCDDFVEVCVDGESIGFERRARSVGADVTTCAVF